MSDQSSGQGSQGFGPGGGYGPPPGYGPPQGGAYGPPPGYGPPQGGNQPGGYPPSGYGQPQYGQGGYGAGGYGAGGYGAMPAPPMQQPQGPVDAPPAVTRAVMLMYTQAALGVVSFIVTLATLSSLKSSLRRSHPDFDQSQINSTVNIAIAVGVVFGLIFLVLYLLLARQVKKGKNWARIVTWVLVGLGIVFGLLGLGGTATGISKVLGVIAVVIDIAIVVLLVQGGAYFKRRSG